MAFSDENFYMVKFIQSYPACTDKNVRKTPFVTYGLKAGFPGLYFFRVFLYIRDAVEYNFAGEKQEDKKPVPCSDKSL